MFCLLRDPEITGSWAAGQKTLRIFAKVLNLSFIYYLLLTATTVLVTTVLYSILGTGTVRKLRLCTKRCAFEQLTERNVKKIQDSSVCLCPYFWLRELLYGRVHCTVYTTVNTVMYL